MIFLLVLGGILLFMSRQYVPLAYDADIIRISTFYGNDPRLVRAIILTESSGNAQAVNESDAEKSYGLGQINVLAWPHYASDWLMDPVNNITAMNEIIRTLGTRFKTDDPAMIAAAYNAGHVYRLSSGRFKNQAYVDKVLKNL